MLESDSMPIPHPTILHRKSNPPCLCISNFSQEPKEQSDHLCTYIFRRRGRGLASSSRCELRGYASKLKNIFSHLVIILCMSSNLVIIVIYWIQYHNKSSRFTVLFILILIILTFCQYIKFNIKRELMVVSTCSRSREHF